MALADEQIDYIDDFFDKRAKAGHVRERNLPHCIPTFSARKSTGGWRVIHAYNKMNTATILANSDLAGKCLIELNGEVSYLFRARFEG